MTLLKRSGFNMVIDSKPNFSPPPIIGDLIRKNSLLKLSNLKQDPLSVQRDFNEKFNDIYNNSRNAF